MEIQLTKLQDSLSFEATDGKAKTILTAGEKIGGIEDTFRPMQMVLVALASCMSIDVVMILEKQKQQIGNYDVKIVGNRVETTPQVFKDIDIIIQVNGKVDEAKLRRAIKLSEEKYCSVSHMLRQSVNIKTHFSLNGGEVQAT